MINYKKEIFVDASIKKTVRASDKDAQYDEKAKKLLGHKIILAYIGKYYRGISGDESEGSS